MIRIFTQAILSPKIFLPSRLVTFHYSISGPGAAKGRIVRDIDNKEMGYMNHMEYFDCEMDIRQGMIKPTYLDYNILHP